ncbi:39S ribosomal protein L32, mitochondrial-like [Ctenocephalides felis]|uniref:39S ribosomal protein L32, mitochondrial-like n=1 Tax=Ctenocephalides felis TaxID=7515 RepID=UPI000E6E2557|nr:39S ribosomal protein L32, mitochondrial-like [Ctenocephalides felis]
MAFVQVVQNLKSNLRNFENLLWTILGQRFPQDSYNLAILSPASSLSNSPSSPTKFNLKDLIGDGLLWAVPKSRRTIEKRLNRKFGNPDYIWKPYIPKTNILVCKSCGHYHEAGILCKHCYDKVKIETQEMQDKIVNDLGLNPDDKEVVVLYDGEKVDKPDEVWQGKRIVEMKKQRPSWFSKNLLQKSTQEANTTVTDIKPNELA